jgi:hypothetical protein
MQDSLASASQMLELQAQFSKNSESKQFRKKPWQYSATYKRTA